MSSQIRHRLHAAATRALTRGRARAAAGWVAAATALGVLAYVAAARGFRVEAPGEFVALLALLLVGVAAAFVAVGPVEGFTADAEAAAAEDGAAVSVPEVNLQAALQDRVLPSLDQLVKEFARTRSTLEEEDPEKRGVVLREEMKIARADQLAIKQADYFLCKTSLLSPDTYALLLKALKAAAPPTGADEPPPPTPPASQGDEAEARDDPGEDASVG